MEKTAAAEAFQALISLGCDYGRQVAEATLKNDVVARTMAVSFGMAALMDHISDNAACVNVICRGAGRKWGFKTDKDIRDTGGTQYPVSVIVEAACESMLKGLMLVGNEFNIITSAQYTTQEGWLGLLQRQVGVSQIDAKIGTVQNIACREVKAKSGATMQKITALISARASCWLNGTLIEVAATEMPDMDGRLQLKAFVADVDESIDQLKGKALCRIYERLYCKCFGVSEGVLTSPEPDEPVVDMTRIADQAATEVSSEPAADISDFDQDTLAWDGEWKAFAKRFGPDSTTLAIARRMRAAATHEELMAVVAEIEPLRPKTIGQRDYEQLGRYLDHLIKRPQEVPV